VTAADQAETKPRRSIRPGPACRTPRSRVLASVACFVMCASVESCNGRIQFDPNGCDRDDECPVASLYCDIGSGTCVTCTADEHCALLGLGYSHCDQMLHRCVECGVDSDCRTGEACHARRCVRLCQGEGNDSMCTALAPHCEGDLGFCISCEEDNNACALASSTGSICDRREGRCVSCMSDGNCGGTNPRCDNITGRCVECLGAGDCGYGRPICDPTTQGCIAYP
jgi:hypothetical protein